MRLARQLVEGLSPVLLFIMLQEYADFKDDLGSMFDAPPPYSTLDQLLLGCQPRVRLLLGSPVLLTVRLAQAAWNMLNAPCLPE